ncbi:hypothetical protein PC120_g18528 [Phytophthora cactorum]|nr:hypothetical protein PC120_g18528 [Phytophthora cactorum]
MLAVVFDGVKVLLVRQHFGVITTYLIRIHSIRIPVCVAVNRLSHDQPRMTQSQISPSTTPLPCFSSIRYWTKLVRPRYLPGCGAVHRYQSHDNAALADASPSPPRAGHAVEGCPSPPTPPHRRDNNPWCAPVDQRFGACTYATRSGLPTAQSGALVALSTTRRNPGRANAIADQATVAVVATTAPTAPATAGVASPASHPPARPDRCSHADFLPESADRPIEARTNTTALKQLENLKELDFVDKVTPEVKAKIDAIVNFVPTVPALNSLATLHGRRL